MRVSWNVRLNQRLVHHYVFEMPGIEGGDALDRFPPGELEQFLHAQLADSFGGTGVSFNGIRVERGSLLINLELFSSLATMGIAAAPDAALYAGQEGLDALVGYAVLKTTASLWNWFRARHTTIVNRAAAAEQPSFAGDLLAIARRAASHEAVVLGCGAELTGAPEQLKGAYKVTFQLVGPSCGAERLTVKVDYDGRGYELRWAPRTGSRGPIHTASHP
ncbi:MAG: hypothetical protein WD557_04450 [Dehalococcoidia bacterium]